VQFASFARLLPASISAPWTPLVRGILLAKPGPGIVAHGEGAVQQVSAGRIYTPKRPIRHSLLAIRSLKGGAGRPGLRPVASDLIAWGAKNALLGRLRRPPGAWIGLSTDQAGARRLDFAAVQAPDRRLDGLSTNRPTLPDHGTPAPDRDRGAGHRHPHLRGGCHESTPPGGCHHLSTLIVNTD
jgi:hypothetical protein